MTERHLNRCGIEDLIGIHGKKVNEGRTITQIIEDGDIPRLEGATIQLGKVSDSVYGENLITKDGIPIRLMYRTNRISTHDKNRGEIPFKDQVLGINHSYMLNLVKDILGTSQFEIPGLEPTSGVIASENLELFKLENVLRMYNAKSSTSTSMFQHLKKAKEANLETLMYAGHELKVNEIQENGILPYLMDTPSTKDKIDKTIDPSYLFKNGILTKKEYTQIRNLSMMAFGVVSDDLLRKKLILVDTKTEHGINSKDLIVSADEVYTMDSSRIWQKNENGDLTSFSKEFARGMVKDGGQFTKKQADEIALRYIQGIQKITGNSFNPDKRERDDRIIDSTNKILNYLGVK